jgi:hypothetical protein
MIGAGETASGQTHDFTPACDTSGLYRRVAPVPVEPLPALRSRSE